MEIKGGEPSCYFIILSNLANELLNPLWMRCIGRLAHAHALFWYWELTCSQWYTSTNPPLLFWQILLYLDKSSPASTNPFLLYERNGPGTAYNLGRGYKKIKTVQWLYEAITEAFFVCSTVTSPVIYYKTGPNWLINFRPFIFASAPHILNAVIPHYQTCEDIKLANSS